MDKLNDNIEIIIEKSEKLNSIKTQTAADLGNILNSFPEQWKGYTEELIKVIKMNIAVRIKLINELKGLQHLIKFNMINISIGTTEVMAIIYRLQSLKHDDDEALLKYRTYMNEGLN